MFECGTFAGIIEPERSDERQFIEGYANSTCKICGRELNEYSECEFCNQQDTRKKFET